MTLDELTAQLATQFDATTATLQGYVNEAYKRATAESRWLAGSGTALIPTDLVTGVGAGSSPVFPVDLHPIILDGATAIAYARIDEELEKAAVHEARFLQGIAQLKARKLAQAGPRVGGLTRDGMVAEITATLDADSDTAAGWVNEAYRRAAGESQWLEEAFNLGTTTPGTSQYTPPAGLVRLESLYVGGEAYARVGQYEIDDLNAGAHISGPGAFAEAFSSTGALLLQIYPTPTTSLAISGIGEFLPADLAAGSGANAVPVFPADLHGVVLDGALAIGYLRVARDANLASVFEARFADGVRKLRARKIGRMAGRGPKQISVQGYHWSI